MAKEIERKFLVKHDGWRAEIASSTQFLQAYIVSSEDRTVRVRIMDGTSAKLTIKIGASLLARHEFEYPIPLEDALELAGNAIGIVLEKTRHTIEHEGYVWEVDVYGGAYDGLVVAEVEMQDETESPSLPDWVGREVTGDARYSNAQMATANWSGERGHGLSHSAV